MKILNSIKKFTPQRNISKEHTKQMPHNKENYIDYVIQQ